MVYRRFTDERDARQLVLNFPGILNREVVVPDDTVRAALRLGANERAIHLSRVRLIDSEPVLAEEIWLPRAGFEPLAKLRLEEFDDLLYPLYERACKQSVATATENYISSLYAHNLAKASLAHAIGATF